MTAVSIGMSVAAAVGAATLAAGTAFARRATRNSHRRADTLPIIAWNEDSVELAATPSTTAPGTFSLYTNQGTGHARIGRVLSATAATVVREIEAVYRPSPATRGYWSGYGFESPGDLDLKAEEVLIPVERGSAPAWLLAGETTDTWVIHVHGLGGRRAACLRAAPVFRELGPTQLVVSYAGDRDAPRLADGRHHFGLDEWRDVEAALDFAVSAGARTVVLATWSMGSTIALQLLNHSRHRNIIKGLVMTSPVMDWEQTLLEQGRQAGLPHFVARAGLRLMASGWLHRLTGLATPLDVKAGSWFDNPPTDLPPTLILHAVGDPLASFDHSQRYSAEADLEFVAVDAPGHTLEWSVDQAGCADAVRRWWQRSFSGHTPTGRQAPMLLLGMGNQS
ncbi:alpha/beta hydrolase [Arthrobacter sp. AD-310]